MKRAPWIGVWISLWVGGVVALLSTAVIGQTPGGRTVTAGPTQPWTWHIMEVFKVENGLLHEIEAVLEREPYGMTSGWSSWEDGMSDRIQFEK